MRFGVKGVLFVAALWLAGCGGNDRGVCLSTNGDGVDDEANEAYADIAAGVEICEDNSERSGCDRLQGTFTEGGEAATDCPADGYAFYCESAGVYLKDGADCPA